jgi:ABC-2 type transport system permease protein
MRYLRIFLLHMQETFALRSRSLVWFLIEIFNPLMYFLYWSSAYREKGVLFGGWNLSSVATYYFLLIIASAFLMVHIEEGISYLDIQQGGLSKYLLKPFSYIQIKFIEELPWRLLQGVFGVMLVIAFRSVLGNFVVLVDTLPGILLSLAILVSGYILSFVFKMIVGISALWITDYSGLQEVIEAIMIVFAGLLMPLEFFSPILQRIAFSLPFSYMIYYPVVAFQGKLDMMMSLRVLGAQLVWIMVFIVTYQVMWKKGVRLFTGLGQ